MILTNTGPENFHAFLGTENPFPPMSITMDPGESVSLEQGVVEVILRTLQEQGESMGTYGLELTP